MDHENLLRLCVGLCLLVSLGAGAGALEGALSTEPGEVVDLDYETLPVDEDDAQELREAANDGAADPSLLDRLLALLSRALPLLSLLAALGVLYALRSRLPTPTVGGDADHETDDGHALVAAPADAVGAAWYEMARELGCDVRTNTPRECVQAAADTDVEPSVRALTELYEATQYGGRAVTDERVRLARERLTEFRRGLGGEDA